MNAATRFVLAPTCRRRAQHFTFVGLTLKEGRRFLSTGRPKRRRRPVPQNDKTFGIKPVDYSQTPPIMPSPLAPPPRPGAKAAIVRSLWPITLLMTASLGLFIYLNEEDDNTDFWKTVETGGAILPEDDDDDEDEEDYLDLVVEEEEEELFEQRK